MLVRVGDLLYQMLLKKHVYWQYINLSWSAYLATSVIALRSCSSDLQRSYLSPSLPEKNKEAGLSNCQCTCGLHYLAECSRAPWIRKVQLQ